EELFQAPTYYLRGFVAPFKEKTVANLTMGCCRNITCEPEKQACHHEWVCRGSGIQVLVERR
ncbi:MAG: hypothetical protein WCA19_24800, partial [Candidatus Acidiferrales bacterium]